MNCNNCGSPLPPEWGFPCCPFCGAPISHEARHPEERGISLGDANAFAGDVSISVNNTKIERHKDRNEVKAEAMSQYRQLCKGALADGIVTADKRAQLEDMRVHLGISVEEANQLFESAKASVSRQSKIALGKIQQTTLNMILGLMRRGQIDNLRASMDRLEMMARRYDADEVQCNYWMILCALEPNRCIAEHKSRTADSYWQTYWTAMAYINNGDTASAEGLLSDLEMWNNMPFGNIALLATANSLREYWKNPSMPELREQAYAFAEEGANGNTDLIDTFAQALMLMLDAENASDIEPFSRDFLFQFEYLLAGVTNSIGNLPPVKEQIDTRSSDKSADSLENQFVFPPMPKYTLSSFYL